MKNSKTWEELRIALETIVEMQQTPGVTIPEMQAQSTKIDRLYCQLADEKAAPNYATAECGHFVRVGGVGCDACAEA